MIRKYALFFLLMLGIVINFSLQGEELKASTIADSFGAGRREGENWSRFQPYAPQNREYFLNLGSMWEEQSLYWLGGELGFHIGKCVLSESQTCQQFFDLLGGVGGRDGLTLGLALASVRWQFVNFPSKISPNIRAFAGIENLNDRSRNKEALTYGLGYGITTTMHERMDLKLEMRLGYGSDEKVWSQIFIATGIKLDKWVDYFGDKLKGFGEGTIEFTGKAVKKTIETSTGVVETIVTDPIKNVINKSESKQNSESMKEK